jgi:glycosyltransferase involved in cell wall biosynthesis
MTVEISVLLPANNEEKNIGSVVEAVVAALAPLKRSFEIIVVDDASTDGTWSAIVDLSARVPQLRAESLSRNIGQTGALAHAIELARGEILVFLDADGQNDPADIPMLLEHLTDEWDGVQGYRAERKDAYLPRKLPSTLANCLIRGLTGYPGRDLGCSLRAVRAAFLRNQELHGEMHRLIPLLLFWLGARVREVPVRHHPRRHGDTHYSLTRVFKIIFDMITVSFLMTRYLSKPMYLFGSFGLLSLGAALGSLGIVIYWRLALDEHMINSPLLLLSATCGIATVLFFMLGLCMEIIVRIYHRGERRRDYLVRALIGMPHGGVSAAGEEGDFALTANAVGVTNSRIR